MSQCECPHGTAHSGESCEVHGATSCDNCDSGFIITDGACGCAKGSFLADDGATTCTTNQCVCPQGTGTVGLPLCEVHGSASCDNCDSGFIMSEGACGCARGSFLADQGDSTCTTNQCECPHGTGHSGELCEVHGATSCGTCDSGFEVKDGVCGCQKGSFLASEGDTTCTMSQCECPHGTAHSGESCEVHGATSCDNCDSGFIITDGACGCAKGSFLADDGATTCTTNQCVCPQGTGTVGLPLCEVHGSASCDNCDSGFIMSEGACGCARGSFLADQGDSTCTTNQCECPHGSGHSGELCEVHGATSCDTCDSGFDMKDGACVDGVGDGDGDGDGDDTDKVIIASASTARCGTIATMCVLLTAWNL